MDWIWTAALLAGVQICALFAAMWYVRRWIQSKEIQLREELTAYISPRADGQPSPLADAVRSCAVIFGAEIANQIQVRILGAEGAVVRQLKGISSDLAADQLAEKTPLAQGLMSAFPTVSARAKRSPVASMLIEAILQRVMSGAGSGSGSGSDNGRGSKPQLPLPF